jgi:hypothetical protein
VAPPICVCSGLGHTSGLRAHGALDMYNVAQSLINLAMSLSFLISVPCFGRLLCFLLLSPLFFTWHKATLLRKLIGRCVFSSMQVVRWCQMEAILLVLIMYQIVFASTPNSQKFSFAVHVTFLILDIDSGVELETAYCTI